MTALIGPRAARAAKAAVTLCAVPLLVWLMAQRLAHIEPEAVLDAVFATSATQWMLALAAVTVSFLAVGGQERVLHRHLGTGIGGARAFATGMAAGAVSQTAGFGPVTGAFVRWRLLPELSLWQVTRISTALTVAFLSSLALLAALVVAGLQTMPHAPLAWAILIAFGLLAGLSVLRPRWLPRPALWPNGITILAFLFWATLDLCALSLALWALFPAIAAPPFATLLPAVLLALAAGLASGAPAGVGAFEMVLILLLPDTPEEPLLAAVLAWRAVFYALPALAGLVWTALAPKPRPAAPPAPPHPPRLSQQAETALARQGTLAPLRTGPQTCLAGRTPHVLASLLHPFPGPPQTASLMALAQAARAENRIPALYKAPPRLAALARSTGQRTIRIAAEAVITPATFDPARPALAGLRRKLRKAAAAGISVTCGHDAYDPALARIHADWGARHGGERGFSMGRFCPAYLAGQRLYVAWSGGQPIAFASFHIHPREWTLDLMRHAQALPDGTMHSLIAAAIADAARARIPRLSLAAVPALPRALSRFLPEQGAGLARFKATFAPAWEPRYLCAPSWPALALAAAELHRAIRHPGSLQPQVAPSRAPFHDHDADYEFATVAAPWHRKA